jgi:epoxyqueuosine reductase QueG
LKVIVQDIINVTKEFMRNTPLNIIDEETAINKDCVGLRIFRCEDLVFGFGSANDSLFQKMKNDKNIIGPHYLLPIEWLPRAKTVISIFLPYTRAVIDADSRDMDWPAPEWLHARIEGEKLMADGLLPYLRDVLTAEGYQAVLPLQDVRYWSTGSDVPIEKLNGRPRFTSTWSERHAAFVCGLGTFSLSRGVITEQGMAGRFVSVITDLELPFTKRPYTRYDEYCTKCGACISHCPMKAISMAGKEQIPCSEMLVKVRKKHVRHGCGKCQVRVPCTYKIPFVK